MKPFQLFQPFQRSVITAFASLLLLFNVVHAQTSITAEANKTVAAVIAPINPAYLASNCANCHGTQGQAQGVMPSLAGLKADYIEAQMQAFQNGSRPASIMHQLSKAYSAAEIKALAEYFSTQIPAKAE